MTQAPDIQALSGQSMNLAEHNIEQLKQLFPNVFSEGKIDFEALKSELGEFTDTDNERYQFTWNGKEQAKRIATTPTLGTLRPAQEESVNWDTTENMYIEGDNLEVLKLLQKSYFGKIKMIYIDPPYNTGKDFVYKDDFKDNLANYQRLTGQKDEEGNPLTTNTDSSGRYHSNWLNMMYPRLKLARNLLKDDGVIFISIDDNEVHNLRKICDEIFGEGNFVANLPVIMNLKGNADAVGFSDTHEHNLCYAKNLDAVKLGFFPVDDDELSDWEEDDFGMFKRADTLRRTGQDASREKRPKGFFPVFVNNQNEVYITENDQPSDEKDLVIYPVNESGEELSWSWGKNKIRNEPHNLVVVEGRNGKNIYKKQRPNLGGVPTKKPKSIFYKPEYSTSTATTALKNILDKKVFDGTKPVPFIYDLSLLGSEDNDVVLDFFSGSATTAHAIMQLNSDNGGNRKFVLVQIPEQTPKNSEAFKAGYETIAEIGKERIRRAAKKIKEEHPDTQADLGFKVFKLDTSNIKKWQPDLDDLDNDLLSAIDNILPDRTSQDLLFEVLIKYGLPLTLPIEQINIQNNGQTYQAWNVANNALIACFDENLTIEAVQAIAALSTPENPVLRVVFRDTSFQNDITKTNAIQRLKQAGIEDVLSI